MRLRLECCQVQGQGNRGRSKVQKAQDGGFDSLAVTAVCQTRPFRGFTVEVPVMGPGSGESMTGAGA
jgi:hypothetical protein